MNYGVIIYILGWILKCEAAFLLLPFITGLIYGESTAAGYIITAVICLIVGILLTIKRPGNSGLYLKEGYFVVALSWIVMGAFGALPFVFSGEIPNYIDALFEIISGFTTTGASILSDVEALSHASLFWRSFSHWIGGMGVFVFMSALLPMLGGSNMNLVKAESAGPSVDKLVPRVKDTAKILYGLYLLLTVLQIITLSILGMDLFESLTTTFGTVGTGGFGIKNDSLAGYSPAIQWTVTIFLILSGINYGFYFLLLRKRIKQAFKLEEVRYYIFIILIAILIIAVDIRGIFGSIAECIRHSSFQVASVITTAGFVTADFDKWPELSKTIILLLMYVGACASSTGGGLKVSRILIVFKSIKKELQILIHPRAIKKINMDGSVVPHEVVRLANVYFAVLFIIVLGSTVLLSFDGYDFITNFSAVSATVNNVGPGLAMVGPTCNFSIFSDFSKIILIFDMLAGRLELFPMLLLITPRSWRRHM